MNDKFTRKLSGQLPYYSIEAFEGTGMVRHGFSTRHGGVSTGEKTTSLNFSFARGDSRDIVEENYRIFANALGIDVENIVFSDQIHDNKVRIVTRSDIAQNLKKSDTIIGIDGLITSDKNLALATFYADCTPLFFLDPVKSVIGLSHSGWRGTLSKIGAVTVSMMKDKFGCRPEDILVGIGPSIRNCHFEVGMDVAQDFVQVFGADVAQARDGSMYVDLIKCINSTLAEVGICDANITCSPLCTYCHEDEFFSHRAGKGNTGIMCAMMQLV